VIQCVDVDMQLSILCALLIEFFVAPGVQISKLRLRRQGL